MIRRLRANRRTEGGFTLVELLVAITALGIIMIPLAGGAGVIFRTVNDTTNRVASSTDAQILTTYLASDVQSTTTAIASSRLWVRLI